MSFFYALVLKILLLAYRVSVKMYAYKQKDSSFFNELQPILFFRFSNKFFYDCLSHFSELYEELSERQRIISGFRTIHTQETSNPLGNSKWKQKERWWYVMSASLYLTPGPLFFGGPEKNWPNSLGGGLIYFVETLGIVWIFFN